jgi:RNA polymerase sigma-70 factor (ECF subfamily)
LKEEEESMVDLLRAPEPLPAALSDGDILGAIQALPDAHREVVLLADVQEFSYREIAAMLDVPIGTVMSRLNRARTTLRQKLAGTAASYGIGEKRQGGAA